MHVCRAHTHTRTYTHVVTSVPGAPEAPTLNAERRVARPRDAGHRHCDRLPGGAVHFDMRARVRA